MVASSSSWARRLLKSCEVSIGALVVARHVTCNRCGALFEDEDLQWGSGNTPPHCFACSSDADRKKYFEWKWTWCTLLNNFPARPPPLPTLPVFTPLPMMEPIYRPLHMYFDTPTAKPESKSKSKPAIADVD